MDDNDVNAQLCRQFSCLRTTDKDELIKELQKLVNYRMSTSVAHFFLDMNDWNLHAAAGSFFDFDATSSKLFSMGLVRDSETTDVLVTPPNTIVRHTWKLINNGTEAWPEGCYLQFAGGDRMSSWSRLRVQDSISPGNIVRIVAELHTPSDPGSYRSKWRLATPSGIFFGDTIWVILTVHNISSQNSSEFDLVKEMSNLKTNDDNNPSQTPDSTCVDNPFAGFRNFQSDPHSPPPQV